MVLHPSIHREIARQRQADLLASGQRHRSAQPLRPRRSPPVAPVLSSDRRSEQAEATDNHFAHRESGGIVVDLFWDHHGLRGDAFRVEVEDRRDGARFVLYPVTGSEAIRAFHHPFVAA